MSNKKKFHTKNQTNNPQERQNPVNKIIVPIKGMHCRSCEILIEEKLKEIPGIKSAQVSYKKGEARIYSESELDIGLIKAAISDAGYEVGIDDFRSWISLNANEYIDLAKAAAILLVLYFIARKFGLFNINTAGSGNPSSLLVVLLIGLTAGISTCMALVGGLVLGISARHSEKHPEATATQKFRPHIFFNIGRIISYFVLGGVIGMAGKAFQLSGPMLGILTIAVGIVMLIMGAQLTEIFPRLSNGGLTLPSSISKLLGIKKHHEKEYSHTNSMLVGALTFFLPCGFTQAMQLYAISTGSFWSGAFIMGAFALGTAPGLLGIGGLASALKGAFAKKFFKFTGLLVIFLAIFNISNGYRLTGWKNIFSAGENSPVATANDPNVKIEDGVQVIRMDQVGAGFKPNSFTIKKGVPSRWIINSKSQSCAASIYSPKLGIRKNLDPGENIIEFTPKETGEIRFSCSMGMYAGKFIVIEGDKSSENAQPSSSVPQPTPPVASSNSSATEPPPKPAPEIQIIKTTFNEVSWEATTDISPNEFTVTAGKPVRFEISANADGVGCMSTIMIPGIIDEPELLEKGKIIKWEFTPKAGTYEITCAMGVPRGKVKAV